MLYTDNQLNELVSCKKRILEAPAKEFKAGRGQTTKKFSLISEDGLHHFNAFLRQSTTFPENFSCGLDYSPKDERGSILLIRCNGKHGGVTEHPHHAFTHIHRPSADRINAGIKVESDITITTDYTTFEQAIQFFVKHINIVEEHRIAHFPTSTGNQEEIDFNG